MSFQYSPEDYKDTAFLIRRGWRMWSKEDLIDGKTLLLCPLKEFEFVPEGTEMCAIDGTKTVKEGNNISLDTRGGLLAFGVLVENVTIPREGQKYRSIDD